MADLTPQMRNLISMLWDEWKRWNNRSQRSRTIWRDRPTPDAGCARIRQIPGIGPVVATAIVAAIGNGAAFRKGREFAAWLGIVPRQYSTGGKAKLLGISKRGNAYLRKILIHGARAAVFEDQARPSTDRSVARCARRPSTQERRCGRHGQQARTHRLGCSLQRKRVQASCASIAARKRCLRLGSAIALPLYRTTTTALKFSSPKSAPE